MDSPQSLRCICILACVCVRDLDGLPLVSIVCTHSYDVNKVVFAQCVQDRVDGVFGYSQPEPLHAAADIHHDHHIFGRRGRLDVPRERQRVEAGSGNDFMIMSTKYHSGMRIPDVIYQ